MNKIRYTRSSDPRSEKFNEFIINNYPQFLTEEEPDLILVTGGDGAMLHAVQANYKYGVPFFGHAAGTLNFLMNSFSDIDETIKKLLNDMSFLHYIWTTSIKIEIINRSGERKHVGFAVNDVVIGTNVMGYHAYRLNSADGSFDNFDIKGTGICISTDLGSTGYNFNLGGPILPLGSGLWVIEGIGCNRYLNDILSIDQLNIQYNPEYGEVCLFIDGMNTTKLHAGDTISLSKGEDIRIAFLDKTDFIKRRVEITSRFRKS